MDFLKTLAPTLATLLGGPLAGLAVDILGPKLGLTDATKDKITQVLQNGQLSGEQIVAIKQAELEAKAKEGELGFKFAELEFKDIDSARQRQMSVKDSTNTVLAYIIVGSFIAMVTSTLFGWAKVDSVLAGTLVGYLSAKAEQVLAYYFGSTKGSADKTRLLANSTPKA
jgi:hypothetical protein